MKHNFALNFHGKIQYQLDGTQFISSEADFMWSRGIYVNALIWAGVIILKDLLITKDRKCIQIPLSYIKISPDIFNNFFFLILRVKREIFLFSKNSIVPNRGIASETWGRVSATRFRNTVSDSKMVTPETIVAHHAQSIVSRVIYLVIGFSPRF